MTARSTPPTTRRQFGLRGLFLLLTAGAVVCSVPYLLWLGTAVLLVILQAAAILVVLIAVQWPLMRLLFGRRGMAASPPAIDQTAEDPR